MRIIPDRRAADLIPLGFYLGTGRLGARLLGISLLVLPHVAAGAVYGFLEQAPMRYFSADDSQLMSANIDAVLADPADSHAITWRNEKTGSHGSAVSLRSFRHQGMRCRRIRIDNHAKGVDGRTTADLCEVDGDWKVLRLPE